MDEQARTALIEYAQAVEAAATKLRQTIATLSLTSNTQAKTNEAIFAVLNFEKRTSPRLGEYEVTQKTANSDITWNQALRILEKSKAAISSRYHGEGYQHSYWLYGEDKIFRQNSNLNRETAEEPEKCRRTYPQQPSVISRKASQS